MGASGQRRQSMVEPINILTPHAPTSAMGLYPPASSIGFELHSPAVVAATAVPQRPKSNNLTMYIFVHFLQHTPTTIYCICSMSGFQAWWVYFIFIAGLHIGGIAKAILFHRSKSRQTAESRATRVMQRRSIHPTTLSMGVSDPEFRRPAPSWLGPGNTLSDMWMSNSTLETASSRLQTSSTDDQTQQQQPTIRHVHTAHQTPSIITTNPATTRRSVYPETAPYIFRHASASFGTNTDSSGGSPTTSVLASRRNIDVAPLSLEKSSKDTINNRIPESTPEEKEEYDQDYDEYYDEEEEEEDDEDDRIQPIRAERVSLHPYGC